MAAILFLSAAEARADERLAAWSRDFVAGRHEAVLAAVEADLASGSPHPLAVDVWTRVRAALGRDGKSDLADLPAPLARALGRLPEMRRLARGHLYVAMVEGRPPAEAAADPGGLPLLRLLSNAADALDRFDLALDYRVLALTLHPDSFDGLWLAQYHLASVQPEAHRHRLAALAAAGGPLHGGPAGRELALLLSARGLDAADRLAMARRWLDGHPEDARAWRFAGHQLAELERFDEAEQAFARADSLFPFSADGVDRAKALIRLGRMDEARRVVDEAAARMFPAGETGRREGLRLVARAMAEAGEVGRARAVLDALLRQWPTDVALLVDKGRLELAAGRPLKAIGPLRRAVAARPSEREARQNLVQAWNAAGMPVRAFQSFEELRNTGQAADAGWLSAAMAAAQRYGNHRDSVDRGRDYLDDHPQAHWTMRDLAVSLAEVGADARAAETMRRSFDLHPPYDWSLDRYLKMVAVKGVSAEAALADLRHAFPQVEAVWARSDELLAAAGESARQARLALADEAIRFSPMLAWAHARKAWLLAGQGDLAGAGAVLDAAFDKVPEGLAGQRAQIHYQRAYLKAGQGEAGLAAAMTDIEAFRRLGAHVGAYHRARHELLLAAGRLDEAAAEAWAWAALRPDDREASAAVFRPEIAERLGWPRVFAFLQDMVARDPEDPGRRLFALERHAGEAGNPLAALTHGLALDRADPSDPRVARGREVRARLIDEFGLLGRLADIDLEAGRLAIELTDGRLAEWTADSASGRVRRYAEGPAWTEAKWDAAGLRIAALANSAGDSLALTYDGDRLVAIEGRGSLPFTATFARTASASSGDAPRLASPLGAEAARQAYNAAAQVVTAWHKGGQGVGRKNLLPELPGRDATLDRLRAAEAGEGAGPAERLATAEHLVEHVADRRGHAAAARERLEAVIGAAMADPQARAMGFEAARLWHALARAVQPHGLDSASWARWAELHRWVATAESGGAAARSRARALAAFEAAPLGLSPSGRWLARSWLGNPGNWRNWTAEQVLADEKAKPLAALVRANGDVVLGSSSGLSVLRQGGWLRYSFDDAGQRFVAEEPGDPLPPDGPPVGSLAEDSSGALWMAVGQALVRVDGPIDGAVKMLRPGAGGVPEGGVSGLAPFEDGVLAATPAGLRAFGRSGRADLPRGLAALAFVPVDFVRTARMAGSARDAVLAGAAAGVHAWGGGRLEAVFAGRAEDALWLPETGRLLVLAGGRLESSAWNGADAVGPSAPVVGASALSALGGGTSTLARAVDDDGTPLVVLTGAKGVALIRDENVEVRPLPSPGLAAAAGPNALYVALSSGLAAAEKGVVRK